MSSRADRNECARRRLTDRHCCRALSRERQPIGSQSMILRLENTPRKVEAARLSGAQPPARRAKSPSQTLRNNQPRDVLVDRLQPEAPSKDFYAVLANKQTRDAARDR